MNHVFEKRSFLSDADVPADDGSIFSTASGGKWQVVVQLEGWRTNWLQADKSTNLSFVFLEEAVSLHRYNNCRIKCRQLTWRDVTERVLFPSFHASIVQSTPLVLHVPMM